jgi:superfamily I DNA/RNA helicase
VLDYDDLLLYWAQMAGDPLLAADIGGRFDHILVDEYQDTNRLQSSILSGLKPDGRGLTVVGDDARSIYSFRAATVRNILDFPSQFSPPATVITLERNYRSTQPILAAANAVIELAKERFTKNLWSERASPELPQLVHMRDEADQARYIVERVLENRETGALLKQQAVLFRTSSHSGPLEIELTRRNIPFVKFGGLKFLDAAHVKDLLALLRFVENPRDHVAGFRVLQLIPGVAPRHRSACWSISAWLPIPSARSSICQLHPARARIGTASLRLSRCCTLVRPAGLPNSRARGCGMSRIWSAFTRMPRRAAPISSSLSRSLPAIRLASAFSPSCPSIHPTPPAIRPWSAPLRVDNDQAGGLTVFRMC